MTPLAGARGLADGRCRRGSTRPRAYDGQRRQYQHPDRGDESPEAAGRCDDDNGADAYEHADNDNSEQPEGVATRARHQRDSNPKASMRSA
jgi:hypothetical protein